jgi:hypothetical protein
MRHFLAKLFAPRCKTCKWWRKTPWVFGDCEHGVSEDHVWFYIHGRGVDMHTPADFGCLAWKAKE